MVDYRFVGATNEWQIKLSICKFSLSPTAQILAEAFVIDKAVSSLYTTAVIGIQTDGI